MAQRDAQGRFVGGGVTPSGASNADEVARNLLRYGARVEARTIAATRMFGMLLVTSIQRHASGRPGPRAVTGDYRRSWSVRFSAERGSFVATVGTNKAQGPRLEYGFTGTDALGRSYASPPFPHVAPAVREIEPKWQAAMSAALGDFGGTFGQDFGR